MFGELLPVFGLAQHYGLPTRLLDWSYDPLVAAYFAAAGGTQDLVNDEKQEKQSEIAVWLIQSNFLMPDAQVVDTPYNGNPNLAAQRGAFTFVYPINDATPLNAVCTDKQQGRSDFHKHVLPIDQAPNLLLALRARGYHAGRIFPGYSGVTQTVKELANLTQLPQVQQRVFEENDLT